MKKVKFLLNQFFEYALECELVNTNPTYKIKIRSRDVSMADKENQYKAVPQDLRLEFLSKINQFLPNERKYKKWLTYCFAVAAALWAE